MTTKDEWKAYSMADVYSYKRPELVKIENGEIGFISQNYWIELNRIKTRKQLIEWIHHLTGKAWITTAMLDQFIEKVHAHNNWSIYGPDKS